MSNNSLTARVASALLTIGASLAWCAALPGEEAPSHLEHMSWLLEAQAPEGQAPAADGPHECIGGFADIYPCQRVDLLSHLSLSEIGGGSGSDIWGWTDPLDGAEYALVGRSTGTAFVDISDPVNPVYLGNLPSHTGTSSWRDIKVYRDHAYIVSDFNGSHGMQVFDLTALRTVVNPPVTFSETAHYGQFGGAHNIVVNEDSGFAYAVGANCSGGLHMIDLGIPDAPVFAGCFDADGYTHDAQCVDYIGPDPDHQGKEICFNSNEDTLTIVDVTDKANPAQLSRTTYAGSAYTHQGWLAPEQHRFLLGDELDESNFGHNTKTYIWDVTDLDAPAVIGTYLGPVQATDHNQYAHEGFLYQANYKSGLRILSLEEVGSGSLSEVAFFDIFPASDTDGFSGAWSVYPFFESGTVVVSGIGEGLFVLRPILCTDPAPPTSLAAAAGGDNVIDLSWTASDTPGVSYDIYRAFGSCPGGSPERIAAGITQTVYSDTSASGQVDYSYYVTAREETGLCESAASNCASAQTTGICNAPPIFDGLQSLTNPATPACSLHLGWSAAVPNCGTGVTYSVYRDTASGLVPADANRVASGLSALEYTDFEVLSQQAYWYVVRAVDSDNGVEDSNLLERTATPTGPLANGTFAVGAELGDPPMIFQASVGSGPEHDGWGLSTARQHSGDRSYFSSYENGLCTAMLTPPLELTAGESTVLSFWTVHDIETSWDGGVVEISSDGGSTWTLVNLAPSYPGNFNNGADACGYVSGDPSFTGTDLAWTQYSADLSAFNGSVVEIRWIFSTDGSVTEEGWYVDDIAITHVQVPGTCSPATVFADDFESGDTSAWTGPVP